MDFKSDARHIAGENSNLDLDRRHLLNNLTKTKSDEKCGNEERNINHNDGEEKMCEKGNQCELIYAKEGK